MGHYPTAPENGALSAPRSVVAFLATFPPSSTPSWLERRTTLTTTRAKAVEPDSQMGQSPSPAHGVHPIPQAETRQSVSVDLGVLTGLESLVYRLPETGHPLHDDILTIMRVSLTALVQDARAQRAQAGE